MIAIEILNLLSPKEFQILMAVKLGMSNKEIGTKFNLSEHTIRKHYMSHIYRKLKIEGSSARKRMLLIRKMNEVTGSFIHV